MRRERCTEGQDGERNYRGRECGHLFSPGWPGQGLAFSAVSSPEDPCPHFILAPVPSSSWHLTCVPQLCGHPLHFQLACQNSVAPHPHQPGNHWPSSCLATSLTTRPDLVRHTAPGLRVREAGPGDQPRASHRVQSLGTGTPMWVSFLCCLPPPQTHTHSLVKALCLRLDAP